MPYEIIKRLATPGSQSPILNNPTQPNQPIQQQQPINQEPANIGTRAAYAGLRGLSAPTNIVNAIDRLLGGDVGQPIQPLSELIREKQGLTEQQLAPQSTAEKIAQGGIEKLPTIAAMGGGAAQAGLGFLGSAARHQAEQSGFGPVGQTVAELGTELFGSPIIRGLRPGKIRTQLRPQMEAAYKKAEKEVAKVPSQNAGKVDRFLNEIIDNLPSSGLEKSVEKGARVQLQKVANDIVGGNIYPKDLWKWKKHFNGLIGGELAKSNPDFKLVNLYKRTVGSLNEGLQEASIYHKKFGRPFNIGEDIYKGLDAPNMVRKFVEDETSLRNIVSKNPGSKIVAVLGSLWAKGVPVTATLAGVPFASRYILRAYDLFNKSKTAQNLALKISHDVSRDAVRSAATSLLKLNKELSRLEKIYPERKETKTKYEIVKRKT